MHWGSPYSFLLLLGAIPLILLFHSLRPRANQIRTTTLFLWERVLRERPVGKRIGWLLKNHLLLILQILIASILIAALADPALLRFGTAAGDTVAVVDLSASMKARGREGTRLDGARKALLSFIDATPSGQRMMVIGAGPHPRVLAPFTADRGRLKDLARSLRSTDAPVEVKEAILFAHSFLRRGSRDQVVVFSDGAFDGAEELPWHSAHLRWVPVEGGTENVGITGFEFRRVPSIPAQHEIMVSVKNFSSRPVRTPFTLTVGETSLVRETLDLEPHGRRVLIYPYRGTLAGRVTASLGIEDDFSTDNQAFLVLSEAPVIRLLYVGKGNPFLDQLFRFLPNVQVTRWVDRWDPGSLSSQLRQYDVVLLDGVASPPLVEGNFILIHTTGEGLPLKIRGEIRRPRLLPLVERHPITAGLRLDDLYIKEALQIVPTGGGIALARSQEGPLIFAYEKERLKALVLGFDLLTSDLPFRVAFPVLFSNALEWFRPKRAEFPAVQVQAGTPYTLHLRGMDDEVEVKSPSGRRENLRVVSYPLTFADTLEAGFYTFKAQSGAGEFAVNLLSESESRISPRIVVPASKSAALENSERIEMGLSLWPFLLGAVLALLALEGFWVFRRGGPFFPLAVRFLALSAVLLSLINPEIFKTTDALDVVLGVDFSHSVGQEGKEKALRVLEQAPRLKDSKTRIGLLFFGQRPVWEFFPRSDFSRADFSPEVGRGETDIAAALEAALAQMGEGRQGKILLVSDGNENRGEVSRVLPLLRSHGSQVWVLPLSLAPGRNEIYLREFLLPRQVDSAETFEVRAAIESLYDAPARVRLLRDGILQRERVTALKAGTNWVSFKESLRDRGNHTYEILVESSQDTLPENNLLHGVVEVKGPPRVLYLHSPEDRQRFFSRLLSLQGYSVVRSTPESVSLSLPELSAFDLLVLDNLPAYRLSLAQMEAIEKYVRDLGGGLIVIGGPQSYGAGGYYRTPLERVLPVEMRPPGRLDLPHVALLFLLDKSGSMGGGPQGETKLDLAKAAAMAAAELLSPSDQVGILAFDAGWDWIIPFRPMGKGEWISERLASLQSDGGTDLHKAMVEIHRAFAAKDAAIKHLLILSDGLTEKADFHSLVAKMARDGITVSTVAVGRDAALALMTAIAKDGSGRSYATVDPRTIPQIFTAETLLIARDLLVEKPTYPRVIQPVGPLKGFSQREIPPVRGYVLTHPKPASDLLMKAGEDPLLVSWRYGLGRVVAFTSDLSGRWGREWLKWGHLPQWAGQLARSAMRRMVESRMHTEFRKEGGEVTAVVDLLSREGKFLNHLKLQGKLSGPDQAPRAREFQQTAPGRYETSFSFPERGVYLLTIYEEREKEGPLGIATVPLIAPYPKEYRELKPNTALLSRLAEETGGELLDPDEMEEGLKRLFTPQPGRATSAQGTWWTFSGLGLFLFLADLALRRVPGKFTRTR